jgi:hypothetical protein
LKDTLSNIQDARPFEDLTVGLLALGSLHDPSSLTSTSCLQVTEVSKARPEITKAVETMLKKGKWSVPGYRVSWIWRGRRRTFALDIVADIGAGEVRRVLAHVDVKRIAHAIIRQRREMTVGSHGLGRSLIEIREA